MRVLVLTPPMADAGGIQRYTSTLVWGLKDILQEGNVRCISLGGTPRVSGRISAGTRMNFACRAVSQALRWRPDLTICSHLALGPVGWLASRMGQCPYWIVVYGIEAWAPLSLAKLMALQGASRIISISKFTSQQVRARQGVRSECVALLPCALEESLTTMAPASTGLDQQIAGCRPVILTVARMLASEQYKGHEVVLRALTTLLPRLPNLVYVVVGEGDDRARIEWLAAKLGIQQSVIFTGRISDAELAALYNRSDVFVLPSRTVLTEHEVKGEGFGIVFLEAMAFGKPVIGPNVGAPAEIIPHGRCGLLVNPEDPTAVADALIEICANSERAQKMGQAGRDWVRDHYSYGVFRAQLQSLLDGVAASC